MESDSQALVLVDDDKNQVEIIANQAEIIGDQINVSDESPNEENKSLQQIPQDQVIDAVPLSYRLPDEPLSITLNEKNGSPSGKSIPKPIKTNQPKEEKYNADIWECDIRRRVGGKLDKFYYHKTEGFRCRSLKEVERFEKKGTRPSRRGKAKQNESTEETIKEMSVSEQISFDKKRREAEQKTVEKFLADARYNLDHFFDNKQHQGDSCAPNISISREG